MPHGNVITFALGIGSKEIHRGSADLVVSIKMTLKWI